MLHNILIIIVLQVVHRISIFVHVLRCYNPALVIFLSTAFLIIGTVFKYA